MTGKIITRTMGIVLRSLDYGESDRIVAFLTADSGKITGIAKGARKSRIRFANTLEPFSLLDLNLTRRKGARMALLEEAAIIDHHAGIRSDLGKTLTAAYFVELVDQFLLEGKRNPEIFELTRDYLFLLDREKFSEHLTRFFELRFLRLAGYEPMLDCCGVCRHPLKSDIPYFFSPSHGGIRCRACAESHGNGDGFPVSVGTIRTLLLGKDADSPFLQRICMSDQCARESQHLLSRFIRYLLGKDLKSLHVLNDVRRLGL